MAFRSGVSITNIVNQITEAESAIIVGKARVPYRMAINRWYPGASVSGTIAPALPDGANGLTLMVPHGIVIDRIAFKPSSWVNDSTYQFGIYRLNTNLIPNQLIVDAGQRIITTAEQNIWQEIVIADTELAAAIYTLIAVRKLGGTSLQAVSGTVHPPLTEQDIGASTKIDSGWGLHYAWLANAFPGASLPQTAPAYNDTGGIAGAPNMKVRVKSN